MKTVLVTGASSGLGKAIYKGYKKLKGYTVIGMSRQGPDIQVDFKIPKWWTNTLLHPHKLATLDVDILINCAGFMDLGEHLMDMDDLFNVNFKAPYVLFHKFLKPNLIAINIASVSGMVSDPDTVIYGASKAALISSTASLAKKYANIGVRINCISPGFFDTNLVVEPTPQYLLDTIPLGKKEGRPAEIFDAVRFIEQAEYMTGSNIVIDGGLTCKI